MLIPRIVLPFRQNLLFTGNGTKLCSVPCSTRGPIRVNPRESVACFLMISWTLGENSEMTGGYDYGNNNAIQLGTTSVNEKNKRFK